jgi:short-subunit dehydrogenase involved in D-alanine esterification of teichoic acids
MKVSITGHSRGIGLALATLFERKGFPVLGFSRSNGYDISYPASVDKIIEESSESTVFINNAYDEIGQHRLLEKFINKWAGTDKIIVNISSKLAFVEQGTFGGMYDDYIQAKQKQNMLIRENTFNSKPQILNVVMGLVDTDMAKEFNAKKINPDDLANLIFDMVKYSGIVNVQEIVVDVPGIDYANLRK